MPSTYTPSTNVWHIVITLIDDSDSPDASNFNLSPQDLADNVAYVYTNYVNGLVGGYYTPSGGDGITIGGSGLYATTELGLYPDTITSITVNNGGTGYTSAPTVTISAPGAGGIQATATATVVAGVVTAITVTNPGTLYEAFNPPFVSGPTVTITGGGGTGATATANVTMTEDVGAGATVRWDGYSFALFEAHSSATWLSGSTSTWATGSTANFNGTTNFGAGNSVTGTANLAGTIAINPTGVVNACSSSPAGPGWLLTNGDGIAINDGTNPTFVTPRARTIIQPLVPQAATPTGWTFEYWQVSAPPTGLSAPFALTKLINGSNLASVSLTCSWASGHTPGSPAVANLQRVDVNGNIVTLGTATLVTTSFTTGTLVITPTGGPVPIDESQYTYTLVFVAESGGSAQTITFNPLQVALQNITTLGQV